jgi:hypothetical protein
MSPQQTWTHGSVRLALAATIALAGCDVAQEPDRGSELSAPEHATARPTLAEAVVSNPVFAPPGAGPALSGSASEAVVYVSLPPGSVPGAEQVTVRNPRTGALRTAAMVEGGCDPIGVEANAGDTLDLDIRVAGANAPLLYMPTPRGGHGAASLPGGIHVVGGVRDSLAVYDAWTDRWTSYDAPPGRFDAAVVALGGKVYVFGGGEYQTECCGGPNPSVTADRFAAREGSWGPVSPMLTARTGHRAVTVGGAIYLIGGSSTGAAGDALALNERFVPGR